MELKIVSILGTIIVLLHVSEARPRLIDFPELDDNQEEIMAADNRPRYLNPIDLLAFKDMLRYNMTNLEEVGKINKELLVPESATTPDNRVKRSSSYKTLCLFHSGTVISLVPCWKFGRK
ncbi:hypothetical protein ACJMK2_011970 [Sinanodonta woodiana]|uniref:Melanin-concentrating hormone n=1 Tax=Sinanodonta woodiana TaxID=1069815 RepID=A0ABD3V8X2_SINWO